MFLAKSLGLVWMRHEWECLGVGTPEEERIQELHVLMAHSSAGDRVYVQFPKPARAGKPRDSLYPC